MNCGTYLYVYHFELIRRIPVELRRIWLYAFVFADHGGDVLLPHFINHYHQLGITYRRMLFVVHHDPSIGSTTSLEKIATICHGYNLECRFWEEEYSAEGQYEQHLKMLRDFVYDPYDWVLYADVNEFQDWEGPIKYVLCVQYCHQLLRCIDVSRMQFRYAVERANRMRAYYITGPYVDRFSEDFRPRSVPVMSDDNLKEDIFDIFPWRCPSPEIIDKYTDPDSPSATSPFGGPVGHHPGSKVVAFRNSMRVSRLRDKVLSPKIAKLYLGNCSTIKPYYCPRMSLDGPPKDLYHLTPYSTYEAQYRYPTTPERDQISVNITLWHDVEWGGMQVPIHRINWASDVLSHHRAWLERYKGSCRLDHYDSDCQSLLESWHTRFQMYQAAISNDPVQPLEECDRGRLLGADTNTLYAGLAWEEFETSLKVVSRVRNSIKGDSRTRLENIKKKPSNA